MECYNVIAESKDMTTWYKHTRSQKYVCSGGAPFILTISWSTQDYENKYGSFENPKLGNMRLLGPRDFGKIIDLLH